MRRLKLTIEYDGAPFLGWQKQKEGPSVQESLEDAFFNLTGERQELYAAGRTDKGVHAMGQVCHVDTESDLELIRFKDGLIYYLRPHISVIDVTEVDENFHARFSAKARSYRYTLFNRREDTPLWHNRALLVRKPLNIDKMNAALHALMGEVDCASFRSSECQSNVTMVNIMEAKVTQDGHFVHLDITANHFLHNMIRILTGTLIEIGTEERTVDDFAALIQAKDRTKAGPTISPKGLYFKSVIY